MMSAYLPKDEISAAGWYGAFASRKASDRRFWYCTDSDYSWTGIVDDFGNMVAVSTYTNNRGY